ncbi:MAG: hypothetical protein CSA70_04135 [Rhodobacterales bacterium]|nr:MAG: hypothetical protein CSA70_04135 [Rhodobacterales bacterium]
MLRVVAILAVIGFGGLFGLARIEREMVYQFDPRKVAPSDARLQETRFESGGHDLVLWVGAPKPGKPVILYFHGNAGGLTDRAGRFTRFLDRGYGVIAMGYRGSSGSGGVPGEKGITHDARRLLERVDRFAKEAPVVIYGESLGTGVAIAALAGVGAETRAGVAAVILEAPYTSIADVARNADPRLDPLIARMKNRWDSLTRAHVLTMPLLVIHGTEDTLIPIRQGRSVFAAAPSDRKQFVTVKGGGHTDLWRSDTLPRLWRFIDDYALSIP